MTCLSFVPQITCLLYFNILRTKSSLCVTLKKMFCAVLLSIGIFKFSTLYLLWKLQLYIIPLVIYYLDDIFSLQKEKTEDGKK